MLIVVGVFIFYIGFTYIESIDSTIDHSRAIQKAFDKGNNFITISKKEMGRLPTKEEFGQWKSSFTDNQPYSVSGLIYSIDHFDTEVYENFPDPPKDSFLLSFWRGEWREFDPSWVNHNSLIFKRSEYSISGSVLFDSFIFGIIGIIFSFGGWYLLKGVAQQPLHRT